MTASCFIADPFAARPGGQLYGTGDRVHFRADGQLEFLGRMDDQVKIRGFRIELGEIEATLYRNPSVHEAIVIARQDLYEDKVLTSYITLKPGWETTSRAIRDFLE